MIQDRKPSLLKDGLIPAGEPCPFHANCRLANERCPSDTHRKPVNYSCAAARGWDLIHTTSEEKPK